jgi:hypothetical protein
MEKKLEQMEQLSKDLNFRGIRRWRGCSGVPGWYYRHGTVYKALFQGGITGMEQPISP